MNSNETFTVRGAALPRDAAYMLGEICDHFVEHAEVSRTGDLALLRSELGTVSIRIQGQMLFIDLDCPTERALQITRTSIAEHLFYFAGNDPFELTWSQPAGRTALPNLHEVTVIGAENITPHMRRVTFACEDVAPFIGGDMHVRILVPPKGRDPVWPRYREDGRIKWPDGADALLVRAYTIRAVDDTRHQVWIDFWQHPMPGVATPGADFARDAQPGDRLALLGPGSGRLPTAQSILLIGDESALPAIARIAAEVPAGTRLRTVIEVHDAREQQPLPSAAHLDVLWLDRSSYQQSSTNRLADESERCLDVIDHDTFIWIACEKDTVRRLKKVIASKGIDNKKYIAWYWER